MKNKKFKIIVPVLKIIVCFGFVADLIVEPSGAVAVTDNCFDTVGDVSDRTEWLQFDLDRLFIILVVRLFDQLDDHTFLKEITTVSEVETGNGDVCFCHDCRPPF